MTEKVKKSFIMHVDMYDPTAGLSLSQKGELWDAVFQYHINGDVNISDPVCKIVFSFFKGTFDRDNEKYERKCAKNKENIQKRWNEYERNQKDTNVYERKNLNTNVYEDIRNDTNYTDSDSDSDSDSVNIKTPYIPHGSEPISLMETSSASPAECISLSGKKNTSSEGRHGYSDEFETFWLAYPRKVNKGAAWKAWQKLSKEKVLPDAGTLRECLSWRKVAEDWERDGGKYIPHPATWLNARGWEDDACREQIDPRNDPREEEAYRIAQTMGGFNPLREEHQNQRAYWKRMVRINTALEEAGLGEFGTPKDLIANRLEVEA